MAMFVYQRVCSSFSPSHKPLLRLDLGSFLPIEAPDSCILTIMPVTSCVQFKGTSSRCQTKQVLHNPWHAHITGPSKSSMQIDNDKR
jgi:hypothetical protein